MSYLSDLLRAASMAETSYTLEKNADIHKLSTSRSRYLAAIWSRLMNTGYIPFEGSLAKRLLSLPAEQNVFSLASRNAKSGLRAGAPQRSINTLLTLPSIGAWNSSSQYDPSYIKAKDIIDRLSGWMIPVGQIPR